jgi:hypothetical protein
MHAPQLKKWTAIIDHHSVIRRLACNPDMNLAEFLRRARASNKPAD